MSEQLEKLKQSQQSRREMLAQFRANRLHELTLPSGVAVWVRDASMMDLLLTGKLPENIVSFAQEEQKKGSTEIDLKKIAKSGAEFRSMLDAIVLICVVEPPIAETGDEDHLGLDEMSGDDKMEIFNWVNREVKQTQPFREGEAEPVAVVQPGNGVWHASE
jgi:hypothetical protein